MELLRGEIIRIIAARHVESISFYKDMIERRGEPHGITVPQMYTIFKAWRN